ncbi:MAG: HAMP domain-containing protein [Nanoarchaeota archaeon]
MKIRSKLILGFVVILFLVVSQGIAIGVLFSAKLEENMLDSTKTVVATFIKTQASQHLSEDLFKEQDYEKVKTVFSVYFKEIDTEDIIKIVVWDRDSRIIFSDDPSIVGKIIPNNGEYLEALEGEIEAEIKPPEKPENVNEKGYKQLLEMYVPITFEGSSKTAGVIETYMKLDATNERIKKAQTDLWGLILVMTSLLIICSSVLAFFFIHFLSNRITQLKHELDEIGKGNLGYRADTKMDDEFREVRETINSMAEKLQKSTMSIDDLNKIVAEKTLGQENKNKELVETLDELYTLRIHLQKDMELGKVIEENSKIKERLDSLKKQDEKAGKN